MPWLSFICPNTTCYFCSIFPAEILEVINLNLRRLVSFYLQKFIDDKVRICVWLPIRSVQFATHRSSGVLVYHPRVINLDLRQLPYLVLRVFSISNYLGSWRAYLVPDAVACGPPDTTYFFAPHAFNFPQQPTW